ncbi:hypothetical protein HMPREF1137_0095 [Actinomyces sp. ICM39]|nr:hypothetical protein HMPREF1137_0095 [Actinomyces sp. ICM39]
MHHMWLGARLWPTVRVAPVLGRFPRLTRPGPDRAGGYRFGACWGCRWSDFHSPVSLCRRAGGRLRPG